VAEAATDLNRLRAVSQYDLDDRVLRHQLDAIAERTGNQLDLPMSMVTVVLDSAQVLIGSSGLEGWIVSAGGTPIEWSFCAQAVASGQPYIVANAAHDEAQHDNPLVTMAASAVTPEFR
jgi:GAF domain-containing protein